MSRHILDTLDHLGDPARQALTDLVTAAVEAVSKSGSQDIEGGARVSADDGPTEHLLALLSGLKGTSSSLLRLVLRSTMARVEHSGSQHVLAMAGHARLSSGMMTHPRSLLHPCGACRQIWTQRDLVKFLASTSNV